MQAGVLYAPNHIIVYACVNAKVESGKWKVELRVAPRQIKYYAKKRGEKEMQEGAY